MVGRAFAHKASAGPRVVRLPERDEWAGDIETSRPPSFSVAPHLVSEYKNALVTTSSDIPLVPGRWCACDPNRPAGRRRAKDRFGRRDELLAAPDRRPFTTREEAERCLQRHAEQTGIYGKAVLHRG